MADIAPQVLHPNLGCPGLYRCVSLCMLGNCGGQCTSWRLMSSRWETVEASKNLNMPLREKRCLLFFNKKIWWFGSQWWPIRKEVYIRRPGVNEFRKSYVTIEIWHVQDWDSADCRGALHMALCRVAPCAMQTGTLHHTSSLWPTLPLATSSVVRSLLLRTSVVLINNITLYDLSINLIVFNYLLEYLNYLSVFGSYWAKFNSTTKKQTFHWRPCQDTPNVPVQNSQ